MKLRKVLFLSADQWRAEALSLLGHPLARTPHLDALAKDGVPDFQPFHAVKSSDGRWTVTTRPEQVRRKCG